MDEIHYSHPNVNSSDLAWFDGVAGKENLTLSFNAQPAILA